ncbi:MULTISPECIES: histidinol-phosphatase [Metabacillus]|uniref:Histidinol-phosphatase n=1 Tax=Metabacillus elymi TaxID=2745198 RepID=A0ABX6S0H7_9BACI|nr:MULTISPECIES: histidinol-phosphatase [Metabacillus]QNF27243.1 histidinol-phosphatase [Metabacillus sp. KUDC1714]
MSNSIKFDLHTHHHRCGHAIGTIEDYVKQAIEYGLHYIGISDHSPYFYSEEDHLYPTISMAKSEFVSYINEVLHLKEKYQDKIHVLLGMESDFFPDHIDVYKDQYILHPFDYIIGSVHYVQDLNIFKKGRWDGLASQEQIKLKEEYYDLIQKSAKSGVFQILGHIDAMKGFYPAFSDIETDVIEKTLKIIGQEDIAIEINTSGKTKDCGGWYPADDILERALFHNVKVTFGSDSHKPERIGDEFEQVQKRLKEIGFTEWAYFVQKKRIMTSL